MAIVKVSLHDKDILYLGQSPSLDSITFDLNCSGVDSSYYYKYNIYIGGKIFRFGQGSADVTLRYLTVKGTSNAYDAPVANGDANYFASNSTSSSAYCEVITYKSSGIEVGRNQVSFTAKLHDSVKPTIGSIYLNAQDINIGGSSYDAILLNDYNRFGVYIGYSAQNTKGTAWAATAGSAISYYIVTGSGIPRTIVSSSNGYVRQSFEKVYLNTYSETSPLTYVVTVVDQRGRTNSTTVTWGGQWYKYFYPTFNKLQFYRSKASGTKDENNGQYLYLQFTIQRHNLGNRNYCNYYITKDGASLHSAQLSATESNEAHTISLTLNLGDTAGHQIGIKIVDALGTEINYLYNLPGVGRIINIKSNGLGIAFGKKAEDDKQIQIPTGWTFVGATNGSSDKRIKTNISNIDIDIIDTLKPVQYNFTHTEDDKMHYGFIAQDVIGSLESEGFDVNKIALVGQTVLQGEQLYTLAYTEFIPLVVKKCQELQQENNEMRAEIAEIKSMLLAHNSE